MIIDFNELISLTSGQLESPAVQVKRCAGVHAHTGDVMSVIRNIKTKRENIFLILASCISLICFSKNRIITSVGFVNGSLNGSLNG